MDDDFGFDAPAATDGELAWRETYVVFFSANERPTLTQVEAAVGEAGSRLRMEKLHADDDGLFKSVLVQAAEDNAVLDIRYESGPAISERSMTLAQQMKDELDGEQMAQLLRSDAWLEVMHFERLAATDEFSDDAFSDDGPDDLMGPDGLDPATLITVVEALAHLTEGLPVDPTAGEVVI